MDRYPTMRNLDFPQNENSPAFNQKYCCVLCRKSKKPFQMGVEVIVRKVDGEVRVTEVDGAYLCLDHNEPPFANPTARAKVTLP